MEDVNALLRKLAKSTEGVISASIVEDGVSAAEYTGCVDTGSYIMNAALSGSLYGGVPNNKVTGFCGESATGKSMFALAVVRSFLESDPEASVVYYDSEAAVTKAMMTARGIDTRRVLVVEPSTIQEFRTHAVKFLDAYNEMKDTAKTPMMFVLDSLGMLSTTKEMADTAEGKETRDMTKAQVIRATFRVLTLKLAKAGIPLILTQHVYAKIGCLSEDSYISLVDGTFKSIKDVKRGDMVITLNGSKEIENKFEYEVDEIVELTMEDGSVIRATPEHKFLTARGWIAAEDLIEGEDISSLFDESQKSMVA